MHCLDRPVNLESFRGSSQKPVYELTDTQDIFPLLKRCGYLYLFLPLGVTHGVMTDENAIYIVPTPIILHLLEYGGILNSYSHGEAKAYSLARSA